MPATRQRFSKCQHRGFGVSCARCKTAELLEKLALEGKPYVTEKKTETPRKWTKAEMLDEAKRLRAPAVKKNRFGGEKKQSSFVDEFIKEEDLTTKK